MPAWVKKHLPADFSAGFVFTPIEGLSSESWCISSGERRCLARLASPEKEVLGINRLRESKLLRRVRSSSLGPAVLCWNKPWLAVEWVEGNTLHASSFFSVSAQERLAGMLAILHDNGPRGEPLDIKRRLQTYWHAIDRRRLTPAWLRLHLKLMKQPSPSVLKMAIVHMDIHPENWVTGPQGDRLIDWEYASIADIALEFAALFRANHYSVLSQTQLLQDYVSHGGYADVVRLGKQIRRWQPWLDYLILMWFEVRWQQTADVRYKEWAQPLRQQLFLEI